MKVFCSDAIGAERLAFTVARQPAELRSWKALSAMYRASLAACGHRIESVVRPEIYQTDIAREVLGVSDGDWHLAIKPIEQLRPFHRLPNVFVCDWAFGELSTSSHGASPFFNQRRMLGMADIVLCCTDFTARTLRDAGIKRTITLPPHIRGRMQLQSPRVPRAGGRQTFLSVADIDHLPRQLGSTIDGFLLARAQRRDLHLVVRLQGCDALPVATLADEVGRRLGRRPAPSDAVSFVADHIAAADFFLCGSSAEGLPVPLIEAMLGGLPLVTTMSSGIGSFVTSAVVVPIATEPAMLQEAKEPISQYVCLTCNPPTAEAVCDAVLQAAMLDTAARSAMGEACREIAERRLGLAAFQAGLTQLCDLLRSARP